MSTVVHANTADYLDADPATAAAGGAGVPGEPRVVLWFELTDEASGESLSVRPCISLADARKLLADVGECLEAFE